MSNLSVASETIQHIRWVAFLSGDTPTADYRPVASSGVSEALVEQIADLCTKAHPHNDAAQFPRDRDVYLFFKSTGSQDYIVTRVSAVSGGNRLALRYYSLIFSYAEFSSLRFNPFQTKTLGLHDRVQKLHAQGSLEPITVSGRPELAAAPRTSGAPASDKFVSGAVLPPTEANLRELEEYCAQLSARPQIPPTFATWWAGGQAIPRDCFDVVFQAAQTKIMTLSVALETARTLESGLKATIPNTPGTDFRASELIESILKAAGAVSANIKNAGTVVGNEAEFRRLITVAADSAFELSNNLEGLVGRVGSQLGATESRQLSEIAQSYAKLSDGLPKVMRPANAFQQGSQTTRFQGVNAFSTGDVGLEGATQAQRKTPGAKVIAAVVVVAVIAVFALPRLLGGSKPKTPVMNQTDPLLAKLRGLENETKKEIQDKADKAAYARANAQGLSEEEQKKVTLEQVKAVYKPKLTSAEFAKTFDADYDWGDYAQIFDKDWLANILTSAKQGSQDKIGDLKADAEKRAAIAAKKKHDEEVAAEEEANREERHRTSKKSSGKIGRTGKTKTGKKGESIEHRMGIDQ